MGCSPGPALAKNVSQVDIVGWKNYQSFSGNQGNRWPRAAYRMESALSQQPSRVSVVLSTYNAPDWLEKSLIGYESQSHSDFSVVVADDGSTEETKQLIEKFQRDSKLKIQHVWHEDDGFRKCEIMNRAIVASDADYLIFSDGDCIPRRDFVESHVVAASPGRFLSGGYYKLPMGLSKHIQRSHIESGEVFNVPWLRKNGLPFSYKMLRLNSYGLRARILNRLTTTRPTWNGHNASGWMTDIVNANGFDHRMQYGGEDRELGERLENKGIKGVQIRYHAVCLHLDHSRGYVNEEALAVNRAIRDHTLREGIVVTEHGIKQLPKDASSG